MGDYLLGLSGDNDTSRGRSRDVTRLADTCLKRCEGEPPRARVTVLATASHNHVVASASQPASRRKRDSRVVVMSSLLLTDIGFSYHFLRRRRRFLESHFC